MWHIVFTNTFLSVFLDIPEVQIVILSNQSQISEGHNLALLCNVKANPKANKITWMFANKDLFNSSTIVVKENTLHIKFLNLSHNGHFHCIAENERGIGNDYVLITVKRKYIF